MPQLGELEQVIMQTLWADADQPQSVREIHTRVTAERDLAYTTVMTVLDRLAKKDLVIRELDGRAWLYKARQTQAGYLADNILDLLRTMGPEGQRQVMSEVAARLAEAGEAPPCASLWTQNLRREVTLAGDSRSQQNR